MKKEQGNELVTFKGTVVRAVYTSDRFSVYAMSVDRLKYPYAKLNQYCNVSICGELPTLTNGIEYEVIATEEMGKYGVSYRVSSIRRDEPMTKQGVRSFLEEITSPSRAYILSEAYPDIIERVKNNHLDDIDLSKMPGIGEKSLKKIIKAITDNFYLSDLAAEFGGILTMSMLRRIYDTYNSIDLLKEKLLKAPYSTLTKVSGIGFKIADDKIIAMQDEGVLDFGFDIKTSVDRCLSCITYLLEQNENDGHTKMNLAELHKQVNDLTPSCVDKFAEAIMDDSIYYDKSRLETALRKTHDMEWDIARTIFNNLSNDNVWTCDIEKYRNVGDFDLSDEQLGVVGNVCKYNISILNGSAGSGKSASTQAIIRMLEDKGKTYALFAPTGKAAKVLADFTKRPASTVHRGLGYNPESGWVFNSQNKLMKDIVIVDEVSMVDVWLFWHLIDAIDFSRTKLLMIGDNSQLPSVGCGNLLHDFMQSNLIPTITLTKIFRYGDGGLMKVATDIRMGKGYLNKSMKGVATSFGINRDYTFVDIPSEKIVQSAVAMYKKMLDNGNSINDIQVITAKNVGVYGTVKLNAMLQKVANPNYGSNKFFKCGEAVYFIGDLVVECANNYKAPLSPEYMSPEELATARIADNDGWPTAFVANGETGTIVGINNGTVDIDFDGMVVRYDRDMMNIVKLGYAITCHKSQGSSINNVILLTPQSDIFMLNSNLLYVGCTRARNVCVHLGSVDTVNKVIRKKANLTRHTFMQQMLRELSYGEIV